MGRRSGKTPFNASIWNDYKKNHPTARVKYVTSEELWMKWLSSADQRLTTRIPQSLSKCGYFNRSMIFNFWGKEATQEEFFQLLFNALFNNQKQIVLTSDRQPTEIKVLKKDSISFCFLASCGYYSTDS